MKSPPLVHCIPKQSRNTCRQSPTCGFLPLPPCPQLILAHRHSAGPRGCLGGFYFPVTISFEMEMSEPVTAGPLQPDPDLGISCAIGTQFYTCRGWGMGRVCLVRQAKAGLFCQTGECAPGYKWEMVKFEEKEKKSISIHTEKKIIQPRQVPVTQQSRRCGKHGGVKQNAGDGEI